MLKEQELKSGGNAESWLMASRVSRAHANDSLQTFGVSGYKTPDPNLFFFFSPTKSLFRSIMQVLFCIYGMWFQIDSLVFVACAVIISSALCGGLVRGPCEILGMLYNAFLS